MAPTSSSQVSTALLLVTLPDLSTPHFLAPVLTAATTQTHDRLLVILFSRYFNTPPKHHLHPYLPPNDDEHGHPHSVPSSLAVSHTASFPSIQRLLTFVYVQATKTAQAMDNVLLSVDVLLKPLNESLDQTLGEGMDICFRVAGDSIPVPLPTTITTLRQAYLQPGDRQPDFRVFSEVPSRVLSPVQHQTNDVPSPMAIRSSTGEDKLRMEQMAAERPVSPASSGVQSDVVHDKHGHGHGHRHGHAHRPSTYPVVALGGTFDHLHAGHKILLSMGAWIAHDKVIVGVTDAPLLTSKSNANLLESLPTRIAHVSQFLKLFNPTLRELEVVPIQDVYGPTGWDPNVQGLVVSRETRGGAGMIASHRKSKNLPALNVFVIDVISSTHDNLRSGRSAQDGKAQSTRGDGGDHFVGGEGGEGQDEDEEKWLKQMKLSSTFIREWIAERMRREEREASEAEKKVEEKQLPGA